MREQSYDCGLLLLGHGSTDDPSAAASVFAAAGRLHGRFADVRVGLLKGAPSVAAAVAGMSSRRYVAVPFFMADGWFTRGRLPRELGDALGAPTDGGPHRDVVLTDAIGSSTAMAGVVEQALVDAGIDPGSTGILVVGHGTPRDPDSAAAGVLCADALRARGRYRAVEVAFLDDRPTLAEWAASSALSEVAVVPYFAGTGPHVNVDLPHELGLPVPVEFGRRYEVGGRGIRYLEPIGAASAVDGVILDRVDDALGRGA